jgi:lactobin A/cerein 7B family class IIb bacteriocin
VGISVLQVFDHGKNLKGVGINSKDGGKKEMTAVLNARELNRYGFDELDNEELGEVEGGIGFLAVVAGATAVVILAKGAYELGTYVGKAVYYATH